jgi:hypothetical protein
LRQAYDYWQDQPGNYFPEAHPAFIAKAAQPLLTNPQGRRV